jgi:hypothetical protein
MNVGEFIFILISISWILGFLRINLISFNAINYVKRNYPREWEDEFQIQIGTSIYGGKPVFKVFSKLNDPLINSLEKKWHSSVRQFFYSILISILIIVAYIFYMGK